MLNMCSFYSSQKKYTIFILYKLHEQNLISYGIKMVELEKTVDVVFGFFVFTSQKKIKWCVKINSMGIGGIFIYRYPLTHTWLLIVMILFGHLPFDYFIYLATSVCCSAHKVITINEKQREKCRKFVRRYRERWWETCIRVEQSNQFSVVWIWFLFCLFVGFSFEN